MVGGAGYEDQPFNIAAYGARQPGSSFKPFTLVSALELGHSPYEVYSSAPKVFKFGKHDKQFFEVENYEDNYLGSASLITATQYSDNSVYAELGLDLKKTPKESTKYIARTARKMGITSPLSVNPAMVLGGLEDGCQHAGDGARLRDPGRGRRTGQRHPGPRSGRRTRSPTPASPSKKVTTRRRSTRTTRSRPASWSHRWPTPPRACSRTWSAAGPGPTPPASPTSSGARPAPPTTTATPGSAARPSTRPPASGSATPTR